MHGLGVMRVSSGLGNLQNSGSFDEICRKNEPTLYNEDYPGPKKAKIEGFQRIVASGGQPPTSRPRQYPSRSSI